MTGVTLWDGGDTADPADSGAATMTTTPPGGTLAPPGGTPTGAPPDSGVVPESIPPPAATAAATPGGVPGAVVSIAAPAGDPGEVRVYWNAVTGATGYRVLRTDVRGAQPRAVATFDVTTGRTTTEPEVVDLKSAGHSYVPDEGPLTGADRSQSFQYVDRGRGERCYRVEAYNAAGTGQASVATCAAPLGEDDY